MSENVFNGALKSQSLVRAIGKFGCHGTFVLLLFPIWSSMVNSYSTWRNHLSPNIRLLIWSILMSDMGSMGVSSSIAGENVVRSRLFSSAKQIIATRWKGQYVETRICKTIQSFEGRREFSLTEDSTAGSWWRSGNEVETHVDTHGQHHGHNQERWHSQCPIPERKQALQSATARNTHPNRAVF